VRQLADVARPVVLLENRQRCRRHADDGLATLGGRPLHERIDEERDVLPSFAQGGPFTEQQAAAGRSSYVANCAGCHQPDLRGTNEARPLVGADFMRTWGPRTAQELVAFLGVTMPPPPAAPGSLGVPTYVNLAAFLLQANGATPGTAALTASTSAVIGSVANGTMSDGLRAALASVAPAASGGVAPGRTGLTVPGNIDGFAPVTDAQLLANPSSDWLMIRGNYRAWNYSELNQITRDNVDDLQLQWIWSMTDGGWSEPAPLVHGGVLYLYNQGNVIQALDATSGELLWENRIGPGPSGRPGSRTTRTSRRPPRASARNSPAIADPPTPDTKRGPVSGSVPTAFRGARN